MIPLHRPLILAVLAGASFAQAPSSSLRDELARCTPQTAVRVVEKLRTARSEGAQACFDILLRSQGNTSVTAAEAAIEVLRTSLPSVRNELSNLVGAKPSAAETRGALALLGALGELRDLPLALELAASAPQAHAPVEPGDEPDDLGLRACTTEIFRRHSESAEALRSAVEHAPEDQRPLLVAALGASHTYTAVEVLGKWLLQKRSDRAALVRALSECARALPAPFDERACAGLRDSLDHADAPEFREAILCVGWLEDAGSVGELVSLLRSAHPGVSADALWSLRRITGARFVRTRRAGCVFWPKSETGASGGCRACSTSSAATTRALPAPR
ncbi:MAG: hypothetical protein NTV21_11005 [Planctomycetota bacterium]|nr:hypothetical protein [Planctomycetota bacterium]